MHTTRCGCPKCHAARHRAFEIEPFGAVQSRYGSAMAAEVLSEAEEVELAMELLGVADEAEMEQFLGKLFRGIGRGLKKAGKFVGKHVLPALGGAFKGLAKTLLPTVGGALGSFIPIPGVGTALGTALGGALGNALELEFGELENEEAEFETARRFVRMAASAARQASGTPPGADPRSVVRDALLAAARAHVPSFAAQQAELVAEAEGQAEWETQGESAFEAEAGGAAMSGAWVRHGRHIVLNGI